MTPPALSLERFGAGCLLGLGLGLLYGFLRPLRPRHTLLSDLLFLLGVGWAWLYLDFGICRGDLRPGYSLGLAAGALAWEMTAGRLLCPIFSLFWKEVGQLMGLLKAPAKKFLHFLKILFASGEKWVTIWRNGCLRRRQPDGGAIHDRTQAANRKGSDHFLQKQPENSHSPGRGAPAHGRRAGNAAHGGISNGPAD